MGGYKSFPIHWLSQDKLSSHFLCVSTCQLFRANLALKWLLGSLPGHLVPTRPCDDTTAGQANSCPPGLQIYVSQIKPPKLPTADLHWGKIKITMCILLLFWEARPLQFKASADNSGHDKSFPICFCPQMLWLQHNMLWLHISKQWYGSSGGQSEQRG